MKKIGKQTIKFDNPPTIVDCATIVGPKESDGPLAKYFDKCLKNEMREETRGIRNGRDEEEEKGEGGGGRITLRWSD